MRGSIKNCNFLPGLPYGNAEAHDECEVTAAALLRDEAYDSHRARALVGRYSDSPSHRTVRLRRSDNAWV